MQWLRHCGASEDGAIAGAPPIRVVRIDQSKTVNGQRERRNRKTQIGAMEDGVVHGVLPWCAPAGMYGKLMHDNRGGGT